MCSGALFYVTVVSGGITFAYWFPRLRDILVRLDASATAADMDLPGFRLHPLKGEMKGFWAVTVRANWRVIFRFADGDAFDVDYLDYH